MPLLSCSIFLVEDDALIRMMVAEMVEELGHTVCAEAGHLNEAIALARSALFDCAIMDVNLAGEIVTPAADIVASRGLPIIFATGYDASALPERLRDQPMLRKPFLMEAVEDAIKRAVRQPGSSVLSRNEHTPDLG
jgi:CheY-like chemotaxis protein